MSAIHNAWFGEPDKDGDREGGFFRGGWKDYFGGDCGRGAVRFFSSWLLLNTEARRVRSRRGALQPPEERRGPTKLKLHRRLQIDPVGIRAAADFGE